MTKKSLLIPTIVLILLGSVFFLLKPSNKKPRDITQPPPPTQTDNIPADWLIYSDEKYKFEIGYPKDNFVLLNGPTLGFFTRWKPVLNQINIFASRVIGRTESYRGEPIESPIVIAFYDKPASTLNQWLAQGYKSYGNEPSAAERGDIETALSKAYQGQTNKIVAYLETKDQNIDRREVGTVWQNGAAFAYSTFFTKDDRPYIYEIGFALEYYGEENVDPSDREYIDIYKQIVRSFKFTD